MGREFAKHCKKIGILIHADFIIGLPGETKESIQRTIAFARELEAETIQVSIAHAYPGTDVRKGSSASPGVTLPTTNTIAGPAARP